MTNLFLDTATKNWQDLEVDRNCATSIIYEITKADGSPYPVATSDFLFGVKYEIEDTDFLILKDSTIAGQIDKINTNTIRINIFPIDTNTLDIKDNITQNKGAIRLVYQTKVIDPTFSQILSEGNFDVKNSIFRT